MTKKRGQAGQMTLEMMLLMTIFLSGAIVVFNEMKSRQILAGLVEGPWEPLQRMIENGEWAETQYHANSINRHGSYAGDTAP